MFKSLATTATLAAFVAAGPVLAQGATNPPQATPAPAQSAPAAPAPAQVAPAQPAPANPAPGGQASVQFINQQQQDQKLATSFIGQAVFDSSNHNLGSVNDIIFTKDGQMNGLVIGVGGFLGIGEKNVAIPMNAVKQTTDGKGDMKLVLMVSSKQLSSAPAFTTLAQIKQQQQAKAYVKAPAPAGGLGGGASGAGGAGGAGGS